MRSTIKNTHPFEVYVQQPGGERLKAALLSVTWHTRRDITTYISCHFDVAAADGEGLEAAVVPGAGRARALPAHWMPPNVATDKGKASEPD